MKEINKSSLLDKIAAMKAAAAVTPEPIQATQTEQTPEPTPQPKSDNLSDTPDLLKNLLGITETIEESEDRSDKAILKVSEQVEKCKAYILYLKMILPILETKAEEMINAKHKKTSIEIQGSKNYNLN